MAQMAGDGEKFGVSEFRFSEQRFENLQGPTLMGRHLRIRVTVSQRYDLHREGANIDTDNFHIVDTASPALSKSGSARPKHKRPVPSLPIFSPWQPSPLPRLLTMAATRSSNAVEQAF
jgi:hypothetical protein